jgi:hypothetical protein
MTLAITEFRCPTCGGLMGEKEYTEACNKLNKDRQEISEEIREELTSKNQEEMQRKDAEHQEEMQRKDAENERRIQERVNQGIQSQINSRVEEAVKSNDENHKQKEKESELLFSRIEKENKDLVEQAKKMQQTIENIPPEFRGTAGELRLFEELRTQFPHDDLVPKIVGVEMPDIVQTIVTESGERILTQILWDNKTGKDVTPKDIEKAKKYKEKYDTDHCLIVTEKGITKKDSRSYRISIIGKRDNVILVHPKIVSLIGELTRSFIIEKTQVVKNGNGRDSKEKKLYDYITSSTRFRKMREKIEMKVKLDELLRKEKKYIIEKWEERTELIQHWHELDEEDQKCLNAITFTVQAEQLPHFVEGCNVEQGEDNRLGGEETESGGSDNSG